MVDENPYAGDMALAFRLLRNAGVAPPWIETDKEARRLRSEIDRVLQRAHRAPLPIHATLRRQLDALVMAHDEVVRRLDGEAPTARQHRRPIGRGVALDALEAALRGESGDIGSPDRGRAPGPDAP